jgi:exodeoxyribonuclease III
MRIATYNVNSIRRRIGILVDWLNRYHPDILCLQETKVQDEHFPVDEIRAAGYEATFRGMKSYNGVATLSRVKPDIVRHGFHDGPDNEDTRVLLTTFGDLTVVNTYVPQGYKVGSDKYLYKLEWFAHVRRFFSQHLDPTRPAVWLGDLNVAPEPIDVYHSDRRVNDPDFHIDARNAYKMAVGWGFTDTFRKLHPDKVQYTYWDYFRNAFQNDWGWRIDHILATAPLAERCHAAEVDLEPRKLTGASDHTIVYADFANGEAL